MRFFHWFPFGKVPEIAPRDLDRRRGEVQVVDVRSAREFRASHIEGARCLPITRFGKRAVEALRLDRDEPVVTICLSAHRSIPATRRLREMGYDACQLAGGMRAWWAAGLPTDSTRADDPRP